VHPSGLSLCLLIVDGIQEGLDGGRPPGDTDGRPPGDTAAVVVAATDRPVGAEGSCGSGLSRREPLRSGGALTGVDLGVDVLPVDGWEAFRGVGSSFRSGMSKSLQGVGPRHPMICQPHTIASIPMPSKSSAQNRLRGPCYLT
jgi:hypothetical protein